jgi:hypothetical protein
MSEREVQMALKYIAIHRQNDMAFNAQIHGHKMDYYKKPVSKKPSVISEKKKIAFEKALKERFGNGYSK